MITVRQAAVAPRAAPARATAKATETKWRRPGSGVLCLALLGLTLGAIGHVGVQARKLEVARALAVEQKAHLALADRVRHARIDLERLKRREVIEAVAREKLKMDLPAKTDIRRITASGELKGGAAPPVDAKTQGGRP